MSETLLSEITVRNYRLFEKATISPLGRANLFVGRNGTGVVFRLERQNGSIRAIRFDERDVTIAVEEEIEIR